MYAHAGYSVPDHVPPHLVRPFLPAAEPQYLEDPFTYYTQLHNGPDIFYTPVNLFGEENGMWVCTRAEQYRHVLQNNELFSNDMSDVNSGFPRQLIPLELDPPEHIKYRRLLTPFFTPSATDKIEGDVRRIANALIDKIIDNGSCEFNEAFGCPLPVTVFMQMMGLPETETKRFLTWEDDILHGKTLEQSKAAGVEIAAYLQTLITKRRANPKNDMVSQLVQARVDNKLLDDEIIEDMCMLLFVAGLDTVSLALSSAFWFLGSNPRHRRQLAANPNLFPAATEELLRYFSLGGSSRKALQDTELEGVTIKKGDRINCPNILASRDPRDLSDAYEVRFDRKDNPHFAFALGIHRCAGSHLARREVRVALETWFARIPEFQIPPGAQCKGFSHGNMGFETLPLEWSVETPTP